ncbi:MAG: 16S rRNA (cytosine(1402)-N(4))-methyltransferase RsmH [Thermodesulfovibrionales bacterium]
MHTIVHWWSMVFDDNSLHQPVLLEEVMESLINDRDGLYIDATTGAGGYSCEILARISDKGRVISMDMDASALEIASKRCPDKRQRFIKARFSEISSIVSSDERVRGIVFDLGLSRMQIKDNMRGFSFTSSERLDMRMDRDENLSAWDVVNTYDQKKLQEIISRYGEERYADKISKVIIQKRKKGYINTCSELAECISNVVPKRGKIHPATKTFQAIRIEVNREIEELREGLRGATKILDAGGRVCVVSYHSIEDREVKSFLRASSADGYLKTITKKPITPSLEEIRRNPSARSAKLRVGEKL